MSGIEELQQRVVEAEDKFGLITAERAKYSERLVGLIDAIETRLGDQKAEIERQAGEAASQAEELEVMRQAASENKLLRGMLQSLLNAIELGNGAALSETMQVLETKISTLIDRSPDTPEAEAEEVQEPAAEPEEIEAPETDTPEPEPLEADALEIKVAAVLEDENPEIETETAETAEPELEAEPVEPEVETVEAEVESVEAEAADSEAADAAVPEEDDAVPPEEAVAEAPEVIAESNTDVAEDIAAAEETHAAPEPAPDPEAEIELGAAPEVLDIPTSEADVTMLDTANDDTLTASDAVEENLVDEADAVLEIPSEPEADDQKTAASSLEDIMRRVSKLVEDEGAMGPLDASGVHMDGEALNPETESQELETAQKSASGA